jgi:hypothetical protein
VLTAWIQQEGSPEVSVDHVHTSICDLDHDIRGADLRRREVSCKLEDLRASSLSVGDRLVGGRERHRVGKSNV